MLTKNVDISDCLINGAIGTAVKIHYEQLVQSSRELYLSDLMIQKQAATAWAVTAMMNWKFVRQMRQ